MNSMNLWYVYEFFDTCNTFVYFSQVNTNNEERKTYFWTAAYERETNLRKKKENSTNRPVKLSLSKVEPPLRLLQSVLTDRLIADRFSFLVTHLNGLSVARIPERSSHGIDRITDTRLYVDVRGLW